MEEAKAVKEMASLPDTGKYDVEPDFIAMDTESSDCQVVDNYFLVVCICTPILIRILSVHGLQKLLIVCLFRSSYSKGIQ